MTQDEWAAVLEVSSDTPAWTTLEAAMLQAESLASRHGELRVSIVRRTDAFTMSYGDAVLARAATTGLAWTPVASRNLTREAGKALHTVDEKPFARAAVPGGWLVRTLTHAHVMTFVPDPEHAWDGTSAVITAKIFTASDE